MKGSLPQETLVLAVDPTAKGFGFAVLEGPERLIDYGGKAAKHSGMNRSCVNQVEALIELFHPEVIVVENPTGKGSRRCLRVQQLIEGILKLATRKRIQSRKFSRSQIRAVFSLSDAFTKYQIASTIAEQFPELALRLPPVRKPWMSEDERMSIFDAVALALTLFNVTKNNPQF